MDPSGRGGARDNWLRRVGLGITIGYAVVAALVIVGETVADPGGWRAVGLVAAWAVPLAVLAVTAWSRPRAAAIVLAVATAADVGLAIWFAVAPQAWRSWENHVGPVRALLSFVVVVPLGLLGWRRPATAGWLLVVLGAAPILLADLAGVVPLTAVTSMTAVSVPAVLIGLVYLLAAAFPASTPGNDRATAGPPGHRDGPEMAAPARRHRGDGT